MIDLSKLNADQIGAVFAGLVGLRPDQIAALNVTTGGGAMLGQPSGDDRPRLESWLEEAWHDWFRGSLPDDPTSDWAPSGSPKHAAIVSGQEPIPPGASLFFMSGVEDPDGDPAFVPNVKAGSLAPYPIEHVFKLGDVEYVIPSDAKAEVQAWRALGHVQFGGRGWRNCAGWAFVLRLAPFTGEARKLTYFARRADGSGASEAVSFTVSHA